METTTQDHEEDTTTTVSENLDAMIARHERELVAALAEVSAGSAVRAAEAQAIVNASADEAFAATLENTRHRVAGGSVPIRAEYGGIATEHKWALERAKETLGDDAEAVMILPRPDKHGVRSPVAWLIVDVSDQVWF